MQISRKILISSFQKNFNENFQKLLMQISRKMFCANSQKDFRKILKFKIFVKIIPVEAELLHADGPKNMKFIAAFCYFATVPNKRRTSIPLAGSEPAIPAFKLLQTYTLDHTSTSSDLCTFHNNNSITRLVTIIMRALGMAV